MRILAIDPGTTQSAFVVYETNNRTLIDKGILINDRMFDIVRDCSFDLCAIEMIASYGMAVGKSVFETCVWIGRFIENIRIFTNVVPEYIYRKDVKMYLCGSPRAKDANIRQALIDIFGGDQKSVMGTKKNPGVLYGVKKDVWAALGVALTYADKIKNERT